MEPEKSVSELKMENNDLKTKLDSYIPRRRVRRIYRELKEILEEGIYDENRKYIYILKTLSHDIETSGGKYVAGYPVKEAIDRLLPLIDLMGEEVE